jgi:hypothetical protein
MRSEIRRTKLPALSFGTRFRSSRTIFSFSHGLESIVAIRMERSRRPLLPASIVLLRVRHLILRRFLQKGSCADRLVQVSTVAITANGVLDGELKADGEGTWRRRSIGENDFTFCQPLHGTHQGLE